jgi:hypothetical protein
MMLLWRYLGHSQMAYPIKRNDTNKAIFDCLNEIIQMLPKLANTDSKVKNLVEKNEELFSKLNQQNMNLLDLSITDNTRQSNQKTKAKQDKIKETKATKESKEKNEETSFSSASTTNHSSKNNYHDRDGDQYQDKHPEKEPPMLKVSSDRMKYERVLEYAAKSLKELQAEAETNEIPPEVLKQKTEVAADYWLKFYIAIRPQTPDSSRYMVAKKSTFRDFKSEQQYNNKSSRSLQQSQGNKVNQTSEVRISHQEQNKKYGIAPKVGANMNGFHQHENPAKKLVRQDRSYNNLHHRSVSENPLNNTRNSHR